MCVCVSVIVCECICVCMCVYVCVSVYLCTCVYMMNAWLHVCIKHGIVKTAMSLHQVLVCAYGGMSA